MIDLLKYYRRHSKMTDIGMHRSFVGDLPRSVIEIRDLIQNGMIHNHIQERYGVARNEALIRQEIPLRSMEEILQGFKNRGMISLYEKREPKDRFIGICRDYSVMMTSFLREIGIAARARCGFAIYFEKDKFVDHWVCEYYSEEESRWILFDAQIDELQKSLFESGIGRTFNFTDLKSEEFIIGAKAWQMARQGKVDPELFGIMEWWGYDYLICNLILDLNSLLKVPMEPWDMWEGYKTTPFVHMTEKDKHILDEVAEIVMREDIEALEIFVKKHPKLGVPKDMGLVTIRL